MTEKLTNALLYLDGVSVAFDGFKAINELSLTVEHGEMRAIIGPNGAGKTTMMDIITGKTRPDKGTVLFEGDIDLTKHDESDIAQLGIGRKFQKPTVFESHTVEDNLELALKRDHGIFAQNRFELGDQIALDFQLFDNRFHHHVAGGQIFQRVACLDAGQRRFAVGGADLARTVLAQNAQGNVVALDRLDDKAGQHPEPEHGFGAFLRPSDPVIVQGL